MKVQELLTDESKWTKHEMARRADGSSCFADNEDAVCWCLLGAIRKCYGWKLPADKIVKLVNKKTTFMTLTIWNDDKKTTFIEVKALIEELDI